MTDTATNTEGRRVKAERMRDIAAKAQAEGRTSFTEEETNELSGLLKEIEVLDGVRAKAREDRKLLDKIDEISLDPADAKAINDAALAGARGGFEPSEHQKSLGHAFVESEEYKAFTERYPHGVGEKSAVRFDPVFFKGI